ncbi:unnamed protein product [Diatraea saccharalis]|uniref:Uncharacterized protein n=1 Tax=Diatraea saccharalis TaxID=40085 RepID=A0A9N9WER8_9NEOP|nr:unnamed protein product [Diatraea saccharalis]
MGDTVTAHKYQEQHREGNSEVSRELRRRSRSASAATVQRNNSTEIVVQAYPDPDYKLDKSSISGAVLNTRAGDSALTYSARCPSVPVMVTWRDLRCHLAAVRMSWIRAAAMRVNPKLVSPAGALLALTRIDVANNELRSLPPDLFTLMSLRYLNAAQNKLEKLPREGDPFEEEPPKGRGKRVRPKVYSAPVLQELYLQDNRLEEIPSSLFSLPSLQTLDISNNKLRALPAAMWRAPALRDLSAALNHLRNLPTYEGQECGSPLPQSPCDVTPSANNSSSEQSVDATVSQSSSRSPSIERSECELLDDDDAPITIGNRTENTVCSAAKRAHEWRGEVEPEGGGGIGMGGGEGGSRLHSLNLSHNQFTCVPPPLACLAPSLARLNLAYNSLRSMSYVTSYPTGLRQLDLSHNEITCWPSLPQVESFGCNEGDPLSCYCPNGDGNSGRIRPRSGGSILSNNLLTRIQLTTDDDDSFDLEPKRDSSDDEWSRLVFPLLSMLDVSCNMLRNIPPGIHALANLAVLNISGNKDITELPPQMGLLSRLWNLSATGCSLQEPLRSMLRAGGRCRSADVVSYLKSVLHEARPYPKLKLMITGQQHWAKRMGNKGSRRNLSTVGVDIGTWVYEKQRYYSTHQYFLSRRSLYLAVWRATDGRKGLEGAISWLRSIQARAPGSPVIMVATHYDQVANVRSDKNISAKFFHHRVLSILTFIHINK